MGRGFTTSQLRCAIIAASGGYLNGYVAMSDEMPIADLIEDIELVQQLRE